jgi:hypothetical protein
LCPALPTVNLHLVSGRQRIASGLEPGEESPNSKEHDAA